VIDTILLVDDEVRLLEFLGRLVASWNFRVLKASDGPKAVELYRRDQERIGLVLLDLIMPEMDGADVFRQIRSMNPSASILITSAYAGRHVVDSLLEAGAIGFLGKPYRIEELRRRIDEAFGRGD
jgi:DNA-binding response OmpR family regulator